MPAICGCPCYGCLEEEHCRKRANGVLNCDLVWDKEVEQLKVDQIIPWLYNKHILAQRAADESGNTETFWYERGKVDAFRDALEFIRGSNEETSMALPMVSKTDDSDLSMS